MARAFTDLYGQMLDLRAENQRLAAENRALADLAKPDDKVAE
jgi:hypothetical protein